MNWTGIVFVLVGLFTVGGGVFAWDWFINSRKARFLVSLIGRTGARIFYALLGAALVVLGVLTLTGVIDPAR